MQQYVETGEPFDGRNQADVVSEGFRPRKDQTQTVMTGLIVQEGFSSG